MLEKIKTNNIKINQSGTDIVFSYQLEKHEHHIKAVGKITLREDQKLAFTKEGLISYTTRLTKQISIGEIAALFEELVS